MEISDPVWLALIATFTAGVAGASAILQSYLTARNLRREKIQDYARQDAVAAAALEAADKLATKLARTSEETNKQLESLHQTSKETHVLVNSSMTAAKQTALDSLRVQHRLMLEIIDLKKKAGLEPSVDTLTDVKATRAKIDELQADITQRETAAATAASTVVATVAIVPGPTAETGEAVDTKKQIPTT